MSTCLILFKPSELALFHISELLRAFHHEVDEVSTASKTAKDQKVCKNPEEATEVDVLILLVLLFINNGFLQQDEMSQIYETKLFQVRATCLLNTQHVWYFLS